MRESDERQRGQSLAELALVLPLLLMILVAMVEVGWAMRADLTVTTACREGARFASRRVFEYEEIQEVVYVAMLPLHPVFDGPDANATIIITKVRIDAEGSPPEIVGGAPYVTGTLPVESRVPAGMYEDIAAENALYYDSENNVVVVEVFYEHDLLLGTNLGARYVGLGPLELYSRSINRIGVSRYQ
jgi:hypothetical protein